jgi:predicted transcriptional regulator
MPSKHRVSLNLSPEEHRELDALAKKARISKAWLGRQAIIEFLERYRDRDLQLPLDLATPRRRGDQK